MCRWGTWRRAADSHRFGRHSWVQAVSHVIPLMVLRAVNIDRWNCNVFACDQKMTVGNYVRICMGRALWREGLAACLAALLDGSALMGVLHYMKPYEGVSLACRSLM